MALAPGARLGVYEIVGLIGAGGMGEVYRARDDKLTRDVAIKVLPERFAVDPDRLARFTREAKVLASLNHPNIGGIYGFEQTNGVQALVLELVEGPTLADRIARGPLPLDDAIPLARQIAEALEAAHTQGIVHRDLKPANIKVRPDGTVKVLDFGLAKALADDAMPVIASQSPTITSPAATRMGVILGTAAYMSPEQARGKQIDKRSDIWAFGAVLYEMLAGRRAFGGDDVSDTLADIIRGEPDWARLPAETPPAVVRVLRRCLEKDPRRRFHDVADVRIDLDESGTLAHAVPVASRMKGFERAAWALMVATLAGGLGYVLSKKPSPQQVVRFSINPPEKGAFGAGAVSNIAAGTSGAALSPDGTRLAYVATDQFGTTLLWLRALDALAPHPLPDTDGAVMPFWSPDGRFIGFFAGGKLRKVAISGGSPTTITDAPGVPRGASWGSRDTIVFSRGVPPMFGRVSANGGAPTDIDVLGTSRRGAATFPSFLPDGRHFIFWTRVSGHRNPGLHIGSIEPGFTLRWLVSSDTSGLYAAPGFLLFGRGDTLMRQPFDPDRLELSGDAVPVVENVLSNNTVGLGDFSVSTTGVLAFRSGGTNTNQFAWFDRRGRLLETVGPPGRYRTPALSPDGQRLAFTDVGKGDIWIFDLVRQTSSRFTSDRDFETCPVWTPDGAKIFYRADGGGLFEKNANGTGIERLVLDQMINGPSQVSGDGKWLLYFAIDLKGRSLDVFALPLTETPTPRALVHTPFADVEPQLSPDGRWLAYASSDTGRNEVYMQPFPPTGAKWQISNNGGRQPLWRADGRELFFVSDDRKFYSVGITPKGAPFGGVPQYLFDIRANVFNSRNSYIPSRDGQRFLVNTILEGPDPPINVVYNWAPGLR